MRQKGSAKTKRRHKNHPPEVGSRIRAVVELKRQRQSIDRCTKERIGEARKNVMESNLCGVLLLAFLMCGKQVASMTSALADYDGK